jgi:hypothetical protein
MMTGIYCRVCRNNEWQSIGLEHLTDEERKTFVNDGDAIPYLNIVCKKLIEMETAINEVTKHLKRYCE